MENNKKEQYKSNTCTRRYFKWVIEIIINISGVDVKLIFCKPKEELTSIPLNGLRFPCSGNYRDLIKERLYIRKKYYNIFGIEIWEIGGKWIPMFVIYKRNTDLMKYKYINAMTSKKFDLNFNLFFNKNMNETFFKNIKKACEKYYFFIDGVEQIKLIKKESDFFTNLREKIKKIELKINSKIKKINFFRNRNYNIKLVSIIDFISNLVNKYKKKKNEFIEIDPSTIFSPEQVFEFLKETWIKQEFGMYGENLDGRISNFPIYEILPNGEIFQIVEKKSNDNIEENEDIIEFDYDNSNVTFELINVKNIINLMDESISFYDNKEEDFFFIDINLKLNLLDENGTNDF